MRTVSSPSEWYSIQSKEEDGIVIYYSNSCPACKEVMTWFSNKPSLHVYGILVSQDNMESIVSNLVMIPTIERFHYYQVEDTVEGYNPEKLSRMCQ